ncbi:MAG: rpoE, partial [Firmicutes bacterium]|nr:rpoE [Bacillota bacterium]
VVNAARRHARRGAFPLVPLDLTTHDKADPTSPTPDELAAGSAEIDVLRAAISELPERQRMPVILRYYSGLTDQEIGQTLGVPPGTVKSRLHSARKALELAMDRSSSPAATPVLLPVSKC